MEDDRPAGKQSGMNRILWFIALWCAGVAAIGALAYAIRFAIGA